MVQVGIGAWLVYEVGNGLHGGEPGGNVGEVLHEGGGREEFDELGQKQGSVYDDLLVYSSGRQLVGGILDEMRFQYQSEFIAQRVEASFP